MGKGNKIAQDKLKLLYILDYINIPLTNTELTNYILENNFMDYFTLQQMLKDLLDANFLSINSKTSSEYYSISETGKDVLDMFSDKLPEYFTSGVEKNLSYLKKELKKHKELLGHYYKKNDDDFIVSLQVMENDSLIFNLSLDVPTEEIAKKICRKWDLSPEEIFGKIINTLTSD